MTEQQTYIQPETEDEDRIDYIAIAKKIWGGRKTVIICLIVGTVLGLFIAIFSPSIYTATTIMVPQTGTKNQSLGGLGGLAALAGIDLASAAQTGELSPIVYPKIVNSIPFKLELMNTPINFKELKKTVSLYDYITKYKKKTVLGTIKKYTIGLPKVIIAAIKGKKPELVVSKGARGQLIVLTRDQNEICKDLDDIISLEVEAKQGYLTLTVNMPEALAAAQLAQKAQDLLQRDITNFKIQKAKADLEFIQGRYNEVKAQAEGYQINIAQKTDQYKNLTSAVPQVQTARVQTKYGIANTVFVELAKQLEQAKIQVKKDTPVFTIVEPVSVPVEKSKPNRLLIFLMWINIGVLVGIGLVFAKDVIASFKQKWGEPVE